MSLVGPTDLEHTPNSVYVVLQNHHDIELPNNKAIVVCVCKSHDDAQMHVANNNNKYIVGPVPFINSLFTPPVHISPVINPRFNIMKFEDNDDLPLSPFL